MKRKLAEMLKRNVTADIRVVRCLRWCCFLTAVLVFGFGIWHLAHVELTLAQSFLGIVWTTFLPLLLAGLGLSLPLLARQKDELN